MKRRSQLESRQRALTGAELRLLRARMSSYQRRGQRGLSAGLWVGIAVIVALWAVTTLASDAPVMMITIFWVVAGAIIILWVRRDFGRDRRVFDNIAEGLASAMRRNQALVYDIQASGFVEIEEIEDEGACYAFQLMHGNEMVFLTGQEFYETSSFPSLDFSLVFPLDEAGRRTEMTVEKRGAKAKPERRIAASVKRTLKIPDDLEIISGSLGTLEEALSPKRGS